MKDFLENVVRLIAICSALLFVFLMVLVQMLIPIGIVVLLFTLIYRLWG